MPGENDEQLASVLTQYYRKLIHIYKLIGSNRVSSARNLEDDHKTSSSLWKIVAAKNKKKKTRKKRREKVKKRPRKKSASLKRKKLLKEAISEKIKRESPQQADEGQGSFSQQHAVNHQFHLQSISPQIPPNPPNTEMDPPGNNIYRGRGNWSPFYRNCYPYERNAVGNRRRRSHLDDIYLPNYEDEDLEERNDFNQLRFRNRPYYWNRNNPSYRSDYRNSNRPLSFVKRAQLKEHDRNDAREAKTNQSSTKDGAASSGSSPSTSTGGCVKNSDRKESEPVKTSEVNSNLLQKQIQSDFKTIKDIKHEPSNSCSKLNDCKSSVQCHNLKTEDLKTEDVGASSHSSDLEDLNKLNGDSFVSVSSEKADDKRRANFSDKGGDSGREMKKIREICENQDQNPFTAINEMDSDEEIDCFNDFITIDAIDTSKSYLSSSPSALDNYEILDMDISPLKRKSEDEGEETTKKARYDSLYFKINSDKLLNEINEVLRENKQSFERSSVEIGKRFRSKSLTLNDTVKNTPIVRSSSMDSIDKNKSQVSYDFDLKTNLLLLLNQKSSDREADASSGFNNVHKVLNGDEEKLSVENKSASIKSENNNNSSENSATTQEVKEDFSEEFIKGKVPVDEKKKSFQALNNQLEDDTKKLETATDRVKAKPEFSITNNLNKKENIEESTETVTSTPSTIENNPSIKPEPEEVNNCPINSKRKYSVGLEEQSKKTCLDSVDDNIARLSRAPDEDKTKVPVKKEEATDRLSVTCSVKLEELNHDSDTNRSNVASIPLCSNIVSKDSFKKESLLDIEEELKSLLAMDDLIKEEKTGIPLNEHISESVESKARGGMTNDKKITADPVNTDGKTSDKQKLPKENASTGTKCTERCNTVERKQFRDTDNSKKPSEKTVRRSSTEKTNLQRKDVKQIEDGPSSNSVQSKPKDEQMTKSNSADKKQKCKENNIAIGNSVAVSNTISRPSANKPIPQNVSKSKTASYYERFKRIQSLFGSDSESEMDEEISKTDNYKTSSNRKMYEESSKKEVQIKKQAVTGPATNPISSGESQTPVDLAVREFSRNKINQSSKESSKTIEKRRCSVPITGHASSRKFSIGAVETANPIINKSEPVPSSVGKPKLIAKKRRETLPVSLIGGGIQKNDKSDKDKNYKKDEMGIVSVVNHKLKDPRKEHQRYKNCGRKEQTSEMSSSKKSTVASDSCKTQIKDSEKRKIPHKNEKKDVSLPISASKTSNEDKKRNNYAKKPKNLKESGHPPKNETSQTELIVNQLQLQSKLSKAERNFPPIKSVAFNVLSEIESKIRTGIQELVQLNLLQCSSMSRNRFPMLQRASSCVEENDCCDRAVTLENVDVNDKIEIVRQGSNREDDVIEVKLDIPIIDLTDDAAKENSDEMITLYRSEETINNSLDVQTTSESISPSILKNKPSQDKSKAKEELTSPNSSNKSPALYISPINEVAKGSSPTQITFNVTRSVDETQNRSPPPLPQTVKPLADTQNVHTSKSHPGQETGSDNIHIGLTRSCRGNFVEVTNQVNPSPPIPVEQRQEGVVGPPRRTSLQRQQNPFPPPNPLTQLQMKINNLSKPVNNSTPCRQNPLLYQQIMMNSENRTSNSNGATRNNSYAVHSPMRHTDDEGPAPMHEISVQEIGRAGVVLMRHLLLNEHVRKARWAYKNELLKLQKHMSAAMRIELFHFENYCSERDRRLHKDLLRELKGLNLTGRSSNVKSAELLMENVYKVLRGIVEDLALWRVYLMLDILMQPEMSEYMAVPFLRDLFNYVTFVAAKIRSALSATGQQENAQVVTQPQDPFTPNQRKILEWQIKQYISICSVQKRLTEQLQNGIPNRLANNSKTIPQNIQLLPNYSSQVKSLVVLSNNRQPVNKINPNVTIHQNITIRPVDVTKTNVPTASTGYSTDPRTFNETFRIRLPYTAPYETPPPSTDVPLQEQNSSQPVEEANLPVSEKARPSPITDQVTTESTPETNRCRSADPTDGAITPGEAEAVTQPDVVIVKQEKEASLLTDQEIETIDLTWINDIDPNQLQSEMEFITVKKEEPLDDKEAEGEVNEEPFAVAPSPADSGISSPPIQVEYDETVFSNRSCICEKVAEYVCGCMMAMYCSVECQLEDWGDHKDVCQKYKSKATHSNKT
ncbi:uncharacterized protein LOC108903484 isoform X2 [Anoplophora glabripennis]|uniref:uncharacterized protein LOC108903484 isoform X2 n=1 Tax=Anoplophora glabripennis TaxID=217634 RepID=UPI000873A5A0|nr:uncharacterized protein LOC108903484 isoform X2 [Anoplophora glabripennis]